MKNFKSKTVVVTGAGSGIGRALAIEFSNLGANLALNDFNEETLKETKSIIEQKNQSCKILTQVFDVSKTEEFEKFVNITVEKFLTVDVVVNNAGVAIAKAKLVDIPFEDIFWLMDINIRGVVNGSKLFLPYLLKQKEASLVNVSSVFGLAGIPDQTPYVLSKYAVRGFNEALSLELKNTSVCVSSVHPGGIKTNISKNSKRIYNDNKEEKLLKLFEDKTFITTPEAAAKTIIDGIRKKKRKILIGYDAKILNFFVKVAPSLVKYQTLRVIKIFEKIAAK